MKSFRELAESNSKEELLNAKLSYSLLDSPDSAGKESWTPSKRKLLINNMKKNKSVIAYRTYSLSEKDWAKKFEDGYTDIGNINIEKGLTSLTLDKKMLNRFFGGGDVTIIIEIKMKKYIVIGDDSAYPEEAEILGNDIKWKVTGLDDNHRNWYIIGEQI
jgi:hypothetical protein